MVIGVKQFQRKNWVQQPKEIMVHKARQPMKELCTWVKQLPIKDLCVGIKQLELGVRHLL